jgi:hypothetical protein
MTTPPRTVPILLVLTGLIFLLGLTFSNDWVILGGSCAFLGVVVKATDQYVDLGIADKHKKEVFGLAAFIPIIMGYLAFVYDPVFGMVVGAGLGLLFAGKLDHPGFQMAFVGFLVLVFAVAYGFDMEFSRETFYIIPLALAGSFLDEHIHEKTAKRKDWVHDFFDHRPLLKVAAVLATVLGFSELVHLAGFFMFDLFYDVVARVWPEK